MTNQFFAELFKKPAADFVGKHCFMEFEKREAICPHCPGVLTMASGKPAEVETKGVRDDGSRFDVLLRTVPTFTSDGTVSGFVEVIEDITKRKLAEDSLRKSEERYRILAENTNDVVWMIDARTFKHIYISPSVERVMGYTREEYVQLLPKNVLTPSSAETAAEYFGKSLAAAAAGLPVKCPTFEVQGIRKDGTMIWAEIIYSLVYDSMGKVIAIQGTNRDITNRKESQAELQKKNLELVSAYEELGKKQILIVQQEKMASIGMLAAGIAHEIKNPLSIILQGIDYLQSTITDDAMMIEVAERMKKAVLRADIIIQGLVCYSLQNSLSLTEQDIPALIDESLVLIEHELRKKNLQVIRQYAPGLPKVAVDDNQIKRVFINLFLNGGDAMTRNGIFTISVRKIEDDSGKKFLEISFEDTGHGIPVDKIHKIFDPFYTSKGVSNTGLGLYISRGIIDKHKGIIYAENQDGKGARFIIQLPLQ